MEPPDVEPSPEGLGLLSVEGAGTISNIGDGV